MNAQEIIYKRIEKYNEELKRTLLLKDEELKKMKKYLIETVLQELHILLLELQE